MSSGGDDSLAARLLASAAVAALSHERRVAKVVALQGWLVSHGVYYEDGETRKRREIDVVASQRWVSGGGARLAVIKAVIECKSANEWSVVFVPSQDNTKPCILPYWSIADYAVNSAMVRDMIQLGLGESIAEDARKALLKALSRTDRKKPDPYPPSIEPLTSGFVETNIGQTKDPEAAVTWKAVQAVTSAIASFRHTETLERASDISSGIRVGVNDDRFVESSLTKAMEALVGYHECYHPIIVTQSPLWILGDEITRIPWCRYELTDKSHGRLGWYDIVHAAHFSVYFEELSRSYREQMISAGARLQPHQP